MVSRPKSTSKSASGPRSRSRRGGETSATRAYHHGDLRRVLIDAALQLAAEGAEISVREAARRAAVSPGAPFRHFPSRDALMAEVAAEAQRRFRHEIDAALSDAPADPLARLRAFGLAYLRWAMRNPEHFEIISTGRYFAHDASATLTSDNAELIAMTERMLAEAAQQGLLRTSDLKQVQIAGRALVYGFARMKLDGHLPRWGVGTDEVERMSESLMDFFIEAIARR
jgi:AcrR family transcriptional regulator